MKAALAHFFRPSDDVFQELWTSCIFAFDASVLLNIYGYSPVTQTDLLQLLERIKDRTRLPYQCGLEFARNRTRVILKQAANCDNAEKLLADLRKNYLDKKVEHPFLCDESVAKLESLQQELKATRERVEALLSKDPHAEVVLRIFDGKLGPKPSDSELVQLHSDAKTRYDNKIPPGFADLKDKSEPDAYGDYVGWRQLIDIAKKESKGLILVIDDVSEDWWQIEKGRTIGPRPELLEEFLRLSGQPFYMYASYRFLTYARSYLHESIKDTAIEEVKETLASKTEDTSAMKATSVDKFVFADKATATVLKAEAASAAGGFVTAPGDAEKVKPGGGKSAPGEE